MVFPTVKESSNGGDRSSLRIRRRSHHVSLRQVSVRLDLRKRARLETPKLVISFPLEQSRPRAVFRVHDVPEVDAHERLAFAEGLREGIGAFVAETAGVEVQLFERAAATSNQVGQDASSLQLDFRIVPEVEPSERPRGLNRIDDAAQVRRVDIFIPAEVRLVRGRLCRSLEVEIDDRRGRPKGLDGRRGSQVSRWRQRVPAAVLRRGIDGQEDGCIRDALRRRDAPLPHSRGESAVGREAEESARRCASALASRASSRFKIERR